MKVSGVTWEIAPGLLIGPLEGERSDGPYARLCKVHLPALYASCDARPGERPRLSLVDAPEDEPLRRLLQYVQHSIEVELSSLYYPELTFQSPQVLYSIR